MKDTERRKSEMLARVRDFGAAHTASFAAASRGGELFGQLEQIVSELDAHATAQVSRRSATAQNTTGRAEARQALRDRLEAISRTARAMELDTPGLAERFRMPRGNNDQALLSAARAFLEDAAPLSAEFIRYDLPADFLTRLQAEIEAFERAVAGQNTSRQASVAATSRIEEKLERGMTVVRQLDAVVRNKFAGDTATLDAWERARHTERSPRKKRQPQQPAPTS